MTGPAERPGAARRAEAYPRLRRFAEGLPFRLDDFQRTACEAVERGSGVLVCAPTGAGKTVVGEFAVYLALHDGRSEEHTSELQSRPHLVCRLLLEKKKKTHNLC